MYRRVINYKQRRKVDIHGSAFEYSTKFFWLIKAYSKITKNIIQNVAENWEMVVTDK